MRVKNKSVSTWWWDHRQLVRCVFIQVLLNTTKLNKEASGLGTPPFYKSFK